MIDVIFAIINFALIAGLIAYGIKRYLVPSLQSKVKEEDSALQSMHREHKHLLNEQEMLEDYILAQEKDCSVLTEKINHWKKAVALGIAGKEADFLHRKEILEKKVYQQSRNYALKRTQEQLAPRVEAFLEDDLKKHFSDESACTAYLQHIVKTLKK